MILESNLDHRFAVLLNFCNFRNFSNFEIIGLQCLVMFCKIIFHKYSKYEFRKVLQILFFRSFTFVLQDWQGSATRVLQGFAILNFARICK